MKLNYRICTSNGMEYRYQVFPLDEEGNIYTTFWNDLISPVNEYALVDRQHGNAIVAVTSAASYSEAAEWLLRDYIDEDDLDEHERQLLAEGEG